MSSPLNLQQETTGGSTQKNGGLPCGCKTKDGELPDRTFEEAGRLAAYYSKGRTAPKVEIDYIQKKHVKKTGRSQAGICGILHELFPDGRADISQLKEASED